MYHIFVAMSLAMSEKFLDNTPLKRSVIEATKHHGEEKNTNTIIDVANNNSAEPQKVTEVEKTKEVKVEVVEKPKNKVRDKDLASISALNNTKNLSQKSTEDILKNLRKEEAKRKGELTKLEKENLAAAGLDAVDGDFASGTIDESKNSITVDDDFSSAKNKEKTQVKKLDEKTDVKKDEKTIEKLSLGEKKDDQKFEEKADIKKEDKKIEEKTIQDNKASLTPPDIKINAITSKPLEEKQTSEKNVKNTDQKTDEKKNETNEVKKTDTNNNSPASNNQSSTNNSKETENKDQAQSQQAEQAPTKAQLAKAAKLKARQEAIKAKEERKQAKLANLRKEYIQDFSENLDSKVSSDFSVPKKKVLPKFIVYSIPEPLMERPKTPANRHNPDIVTQDEYVNFMFVAIARNNMDDFRSLYNIVRDPNIFNSYGDSVLIFAIITQRYEAIASLLANGANPNLKNQLGYTPVSVAIEMSDYIAAELLVKGGADLKYSDNYGVNYLMEAIKVGYFPIIDFLIEKGIDINLTDRDGFTALDYAMRNGDRILIKYLEKLGAKTGTDKKRQDIRQDRSLIEQLQNRWK